MFFDKRIGVTVSGSLYIFLKDHFQIKTGEFDPGSERTLAACLTHASRTRNPGQPGE